MVALRDRLRVRLRVRFPPVTLALIAAISSSVMFGVENMMLSACRAVSPFFLLVVLAVLLSAAEGGGTYSGTPTTG